MPTDDEIEVAGAWKGGGKRHFVMAHALELLIAVGYQGLTMRGIADRCGMSLSNVQYYFRTKEDLITEIADRYFGECDAVLSTYFEKQGPVETREALHDLVGLFLEHGREMTDMCRVFRELWAIGSRNENVSELLDCHYRRIGRTLSRHLKYPSTSPAAVDRMVALLLVMSEGFSIVGKAQTMDHSEATSFFTDVLIAAAGRGE